MVECSCQKVSRPTFFEKLSILKWACQSRTWYRIFYGEETRNLCIAVNILWKLFVWKYFVKLNALNKMLETNQNVLSTKIYRKAFNRWCLVLQSGWFWYGSVLTGLGWHQQVCSSKMPIGTRTKHQNASFGFCQPWSRLSINNNFFGHKLYGILWYQKTYWLAWKTLNNKNQKISDRRDHWNKSECLGYSSHSLIVQLEAWSW